jgi:hypothetical protein
MAIAWLTVTLLAFELPAVNLGTFLSGNPHMIAVMVKRALSTLFGLPPAIISTECSAGSRWLAGEGELSPGVKADVRG